MKWQSLLLKQEGYQVTLTRYSKGGGVDIEAVDANDRPLIVQAKQYRKNVGVGTVQEMIGVRHTRGNNPHTIIFSLVGFTKGAFHLAEQEGIELRDIRNEKLQTRPKATSEFPAESRKDD